MADVGPELIRDISVKAVEDFLNNKVPLSDSLAKQAAAYDLNSEQVKRAVESANNIAYLKILQVSDDRTVEFPLAKYAEVMGAATLPDHFTEKVAAAITVETPVQIEKVASVETTRELTDAEKVNYLIKSAAANKQALERLEVESINLAQDLVKVAKEIAKDSKWMDKLACVADEQSFSELSLLASGKVEKYRDLKSFGLFKEAELKSVAKFAGMYKQAQALVREQRERIELQKRADDTMSSMKNGFFDGARSAAKATTQKIVGAPAYALGRGLGAAASTPFRAAGAAASTVKDTFHQNLSKALKGGSGKVTGTVKAVGSTGSSVAGKIMGAAGPIADAAFYDPGVDKTTGRSNDVWSALQKD